MKGPHAPFPSIDLFVKECQPESWKNIPVPLVEAMNLLTKCMHDIKNSIHSNYNDNCTIGRVLHLNTLNGKREVGTIKTELLDELDLRDMARA